MLFPILLLTLVSAAGCSDRPDESNRMFLAVFGQPRFTIPVQKLPEPTAEGMASEASNRAVPACNAFVTVSEASPRIGFA